MRCNSFLRVAASGAIALGVLFILSMPATATAQGESTPARNDGMKLAVRLDTSQPSTPQQAGSKARNGPVKLTPQITPWKQIVVEAGDSLSGLFARHGIRNNEWARVLELGDTVDPLRHLQPGDKLSLRRAPNGALAELRFDLDAVDTLAVTRRGARLYADIVHLNTQTRRISVHGTVEGSLPHSLERAGVPAKIATQLASIYRYRADLSQDVHPGDQFSIIYAAEFDGDQRLEIGPIIAASLTTATKNLQTFRAVNENGEAGYYDARGRSYQPSISRRPVDYERVSSPFDPSRLHPILHVRRPHNGVDLAAARGAPIHAAANGVVKFAGYKHGYGRMVTLEHSDDYSTRYAHMARIIAELHDGKRVAKGQIIGYVGATGEATGPHLHFEIRADGVPHNPLTMDLPSSTPIPKNRLAAFTRRIRPLIARLDGIPGMSNTLIAANARLTDPRRCSKAVVVNAALALDPTSASRHHTLGDLFCVVAANDKA